MSEKRWLEIGFSSKRMSAMAIINVETDTFIDAKIAVEQRLEGDLPLQINYMRAGGSLEQQLTAEESAYFVGRKYNH